MPGSQEAKQVVTIRIIKSEYFIYLFILEEGVREREKH